MRADRLVGILLLMQQRGQVTARQVADEFEVSVRTARRDLEALGMAGLPVYSTPGRGGGWQLLGDGRTDLSGLSTDEAVALFAAVGSVRSDQPLANETRSALRKLTTALPQSARTHAERAASSMRVLPARSSRRRPDDDVVDAVRASITGAYKASLTYRSRNGDATTRTISPLGLVVRDMTWYLIAGTDAGQRTFRVDRIVGYDPLDEPVEVGDDFDLDVAWDEVEAAIEVLRWSVVAEVTIEPGALGRARYVLGERLVVDDEPIDDDDSPINAVVRGGSAVELAAVIAGLWPSVVVDGPAEVCDALGSLGRGLVETYGRSDS